MNQGDYSHTDLTQLAVMLRDLTEAVQIQARELNRLAVLVEQQTDLRDRPKEGGVAASTVTALHQQATRLAERLEDAENR